MNISENSFFKKKDKTSKYWIHKVDVDVLRQIDEEKLLGAEKKRSRIINEISVNDKIILFSTLEVNKSICFVAYTMVDQVYENNDPLYDHYESKKKLKLKGVKYFSTPIVTRNLAEKLEFIENVNLSAKYFKAEYREISRGDFQTIFNNGSLTKDFPAYFETVSFTLDEFLINSISFLYSLLQKYEKRNQIEIKIFLKLLKKSLQSYGMSKSYEEIEDFYAKNAWKLGFKHNPSRDPDKFVELYNRNGKKRNFSYISLEQVGD